MKRATQYFELRRSVSVAAIALGVVCVLAAGTEAEDRIDVANLKALDVHGGVHAIDSDAQRLGTAFVFLSTECPISRQYIPELNRVAEASSAANVALYGVMSDESLTRRAASRFVDEFQVAFPVLFDASGELADRFGPKHVPEAFVIDTAGNVVYRGRIDDLYPEIGKRRLEATRRDLLAAITALSEGRTVAEPRTIAVGCPFERRNADRPDAKVTYTRDIAPIVFAQCVECHRPGEVAPFSLITYEDAAKRAEAIARVTQKRLMPPWRAEHDFGHFFDERRLTDRQIALIQAWANSDRAEGDAADLPPAPKFKSGWRLGEPDAVAEVSTPLEFPADGPDIFQHVVIPLEIAKDEMLVGFEFRAGNPAIVHHTIVFLDSSGRARARDAETPEPGWRTSGSIDAGITSHVGVWTPGMTPRLFPQNVGIPLTKGTDVVLQLHIHPSGKIERDQSKVAFYFAKRPVTRVMSRNPLLLGSLAIEIPPGEKQHRLSSTVTLPVGLTLTSVFPHMHLIAREMKVTAALPDGASQPLIWIKDWNFYWQDSYVYRNPVHLPAGTRLTVEASYDNSAENPFNPRTPPKTVLFGNDTTDEMCFALFQAVADEPDGLKRIGPALMQSLMQEWNTASISAEGRAYIMSEAAKLFGGRRGNQRPKPTQDGTEPQKVPESSGQR